MSCIFEFIGTMCSGDHIICSISIPGIFFFDMPAGGNFNLGIGGGIFSILDMLLPFKSRAMAEPLDWSCFGNMSGGGFLSHSVASIGLRQRDRSFVHIKPIFVVGVAIFCSCRAFYGPASSSPRGMDINASQFRMEAIPRVE